MAQSACFKTNRRTLALAIEAGHVSWPTSRRSRSRLRHGDLFACTDSRIQLTVKCDGRIMPRAVDTNVILESHPHRFLAPPRAATALNCRGCFAKRSAQRRRPEQRIDANALRTSMAAVHRVRDRERAELAVRVPDIALDRGEASLWAHAVHREDSWLLCGPDTASLRFGIRLGFRDRLVSLERLLDNVGHRPNPPLRAAYTRKWHDRTLGHLVLAEHSQS